MDYIFYIVIAILLIVIIVLTINMLIRKKQIISMEKQLKNSQDYSYNKQIQLTLIDKDLTDLAVLINKNLDFQKTLKLQHETTERQLKQSISDIAHDLRTPLTVIKGNLQLLLNESSASEHGAEAETDGVYQAEANVSGSVNKLNDAQIEYIKICMEKADVLKQMIDDFFELSVLESDIDEVPVEKINATNLIMQFVLDHEALIREKELTPDIVLPEKTVTMMADAAFVGRMLSNLLNNILKYGKNEFTVGLREETESVVIYFANEIMHDTKIDVDRLFERTYRADTARKEGSAGLGLYIVKVLAEKQGGSASAHLDGRKLVVELSFKK